MVFPETAKQLARFFYFTSLFLQHMKYTLKNQKRSCLPSVDMYVARAVHNEVVDTEQIATKIQENCTLKRSDVRLHLIPESRNGCQVLYEDIKFQRKV